MSCKLHLPCFYVPQLDAVCCRCGEVFVTAVESAATEHWRWFFRRDR